MGMLCLTRREGQSVVIETPAGVIRIRTKDIRRGMMRLNIDAPAEFKVLREEVKTKGEKRESQRKENQSAG